MTQLETQIAAETSFEETLLRELVAGDLLSEENADRARRAHARTNSSVVDVLVRLGLCAERDLAPMVARVTNCALIDAADFPQSTIDAPISQRSRQPLAQALTIPLPPSSATAAFSAGTSASDPAAAHEPFGCPSGRRFVHTKR